HVVDGDEGGKGRAGVGKRLEDQHRVEPAQRRTADIVAYVNAAEAERPGFADHVGGEMMVAVPGERVRLHAVGREGLRHFLNGTLVVVQFELSGGRIDYGVHDVLADGFSLLPGRRFGYAWAII